jgi:4-methyl-5(b-hydroxyethyl)-thiazole monophosphate biosynthesis
MISISDDLMVEGSHGIRIVADAVIDEIDLNMADGIFLPGGIPGTPNLAACKALTDTLVDYNEKGKLVSAICAAPSILSNLGILKDKKATSYPSFEEKMNCREYGGRVVRDGNVITGRGLGTALEEGLEIISYFLGEEEAKRISKSVCFVD